METIAAARKAAIRKAGLNRTMQYGNMYFRAILPLPPFV